MILATIVYYIIKRSSPVNQLIISRGGEFKSSLVRVRSSLLAKFRLLLKIQIESLPLIVVLLLLNGQLLPIK